MKFILSVFAALAGAAAGYVIGDEQAFTWPAGIAAAAAGLALLLQAIIPESSTQTVSLRRSTSTPRASASPRPRPLLPGEAARLRDQERVLSSGAEVGVRLVDTGRNQIAVIKVLRNYLDLGLKEAKDLSDGAKQGGRPLLAEAMPSDRARDFGADIEDAGGRLEFEEGSAIR